MPLTGLAIETHHGPEFSSERKKLSSRWQHCCLKVLVTGTESQGSVLRAGILLYDNDAVQMDPWDIDEWRSCYWFFVKMIIAISLFTVNFLFFITEQRQRREAHLFCTRTRKTYDAACRCSTRVCSIYSRSTFPEQWVFGAGEGPQRSDYVD